MVNNAQYSHFLLILSELWSKKMQIDEKEREQIKRTTKRLEKIINALTESMVFVEGQKDKKALLKIGCKEVLTVSGNLRNSSLLASNNHTKKVIVLTDLDRRGNELAVRAREELEGFSIKVNTEYRTMLGGILKIRYFEEIDGKYEKFMEELENKL